MQTSSNILDNHINIQSYLNLGSHADVDNGYHYIQAKFQEPLDAQYSNFQSSLPQQQILLAHKRSTGKALRQTQPSTLSSNSYKKSAKQATAKYRQRRKQYQQQLQAQVKTLEQELSKTQTEIKEVKDALLVKLESSVKSVNSSENAEIYQELEGCIGRGNQEEGEVDIDKINLLLNTLKFRIGPTGRQRHAKIEYNFKNIVNTLFPGLLRYFIITAAQNKDIFSQSPTNTTPPSWTAQLLQKMNLTPAQIDSIKKSEESLKVMHSGTINKISRLKGIKLKMKQEALLMDKQQDEFRENLSAVQCAKLTMFCERHKYRKNISLDQKFRGKMEGTMIEEEMQVLLQSKLGSKRVKRDKDAGQQGRD